MFNLDEGRLDIRIRSVKYKAERDVLPYYYRRNRHSNSLVFYLKGGHRHTFEDGSECVSRDNDILFLPYGSNYVNRVIDSRIEYYQIDFEIFDNGEKVSLWDKPRLVSPFDVDGALQRFVDIYNLYTARPYAYTISALGNLLFLISLLLQEIDANAGVVASKKRISFAFNFLNNRYFENISISELASLSNMSVSNLEKNFLSATGRTPSDYRNSIRIEHAKTLLISGFSIRETSERVGYSDIYYFAKMFKRYTGQTPGKYSKK